MYSLEEFNDRISDYHDSYYYVDSSDIGHKGLFGFYDFIKKEKITDMGYKNKSEFIKELYNRFYHNENVLRPVGLGTVTNKDYMKLDLYSRKTNNLYTTLIIHGEYLFTYPHFLLKLVNKKYKTRKNKALMCDDHYDDDYDPIDEIASAGYEYSQADLDNHANQCNPNNDAYWSSRE